MRARNLDRRLDAATGRVCDLACEHFVGLLSNTMTPAEVNEAKRLFMVFWDLELERGTPSKLILARLPREFASELGAAMLRYLDARKERRAKARGSSAPAEPAEIPSCRDELA